MDKQSAKAKVEQYLKSLPISNPDDEYVVIEEMTLEKPYGWIFRFNSKLYIETGNFMYALGGNGPIIVMAITGELHRLGSSLAGEQAIAEFENKMQLAS